MQGMLYLHYSTCFYDILLKCILSSMTLRTVKIKTTGVFCECSPLSLQYSVLKKQHQLNLQSQYTLFPQIKKTSYHKHCSGGFTIHPVELQGCLLSVLLNCYGVYNLSCWTYAVLPIFPVELLGYLPSVLLNCYICLPSVLLNCYICLPSVLLNCYNTSHLSCWTAWVLTISSVKLLQCFPSFLLNCLGTYHQFC